MSKIICEICGTVYPDNATVCPICGCPRTSGDETDLPVQEAGAEGAVRTAQRVKGGRFSNKNVKKRNNAANSDVPRRPVAVKEEKPAEEKSNRGLIIAVVILLIAVILMAVYLGSRFLGGSAGRSETSAATTAVTTAAPETTLPEQTSVACTDLDISGIDLTQGVQLKGEGKTWRMAVTAVPENATEEITYTSSDESVVAVNVNGKRVDLVYVAPGSATITISCGSVSKQFTVQCEAEETTAATEESTETTETEETTKPEEPGKLSLSSEDFTLFAEGETAVITPGKGISPAQCTWTSADDSIASVENGKVTAVAPGTTKITVEFDGQKATCTVRCRWEDEDATDPTDATDSTDTTEETQATETTGSSDEKWEISRSDVTISVGEAFTLQLVSSSGETADVSWSTYSWLNGGNVSVSGDTVTGVTSGECTVSCTYNGVEYKCVVHIK